jgi:UDP-glucuronate decarboxylase
MKKILVTGGAGFLGSHVCRVLAQQGHTVYCIDNVSTGKLENIEGVSVNFHKGDIRFAPVGVFSHIELDEIYNFACPASPKHYREKPIDTLLTSVIGVRNLLEIAKETGAKILQASTSEVYGDPLEHPQKERYKGNVNCIGPRACYDEGKRAAETLCFDYYREYGVDVKVVRIFNTYGPRMDPEDGRVISNFIMQAINGEDITIYGDGSQTRSFMYVSDLIGGLTKMMDSACIGPINLGNPTEYTIQDLAERIVSMSNTESNIVYKDLPIDDPCRRKPDITLARKLLHWHPRVSLEQGLIATIKYYESVRRKWLVKA